MLAAVDLDLLQSVSLAIGVQRQTEMNPITIVFAGINDHLHSRGFLSRLRDPATAENAVWPAIKDILESMGEVVDATKEGSFNKVTLRVVFALSPGYAYLPDGLKFVYAMVALLSEGKYDVIISAPNRMIEMENLRPLKAELPAVWSDISNAMRGFKDHALHMLVLDEVLGLELSNFSRQLKLKPGIDDDHRVITAMSNDLWFRAMEVASEDTRRKNSLETRAHLEAMVLRTKPEANQWLHLNPRVAALGADAFQQGPVMITKIHAYLLKEVNLAENAGEKTAEFVNRMCQITLETFWTQEVKGQEGFERTDSMLEGLGAGWTASLFGKSLPESLALLDKGIPPSGSESIDSGINSPVCDIWSGEFRERTGDTAYGWNTEPATRWTSDIDRNNPRKLGRTDETGTLSRADERESEESGYEEIHRLVEQNKRSETHSYPVSLAAKSLWNRRRRDN